MLTVAEVEGIVSNLETRAGAVEALLLKVMKRERTRTFFRKFDRRQRNGPKQKRGESKTRKLYELCGQKLSMRELVIVSGLPATTIRTRMRGGMALEEALFVPLHGILRGKAS